MSYIYKMKTIIGILVFIGWASISTHWYVCKIKGLCETEKTTEIEPKIEPVKKIVVEEIKKDSNIVHFDYESLTIHFSSAKSETKLTKTLSDSIQQFANKIKKAEKNILIIGNTDNVGSNHYNMKLGLKRALWIQDLFLSYSIDKKNIEVKSNGENISITNNNSEKNRSKNRRVEINIKN